MVKSSLTQDCAGVVALTWIHLKTLSSSIYNTYVSLLLFITGIDLLPKNLTESELKKVFENKLLPSTTCYSAHMAKPSPVVMAQFAVHARDVVQYIQHFPGHAPVWPSSSVSRATVIKFKKYGEGRGFESLRVKRWVFFCFMWPVLTCSKMVGREKCRNRHAKKTRESESSR